MDRCRCRSGAGRVCNGCLPSVRPRPPNQTPCIGERERQRTEPSIARTTTPARARQHGRVWLGCCAVAGQPAVRQPDAAGQPAAWHFAIRCATTTGGTQSHQRPASVAFTATDRRRIVAFGGVIGWSASRGAGSVGGAGTTTGGGCPPSFTTSKPTPVARVGSFEVTTAASSVAWCRRCAAHCKCDRPKMGSSLSNDGTNAQSFPPPSCTANNTRCNVTQRIHTTHTQLTCLPPHAPSTHGGTIYDWPPHRLPLASGLPFHGCKPSPLARAASNNPWLTPSLLRALAAPPAAADLACGDRIGLLNHCGVSPPSTRRASGVGVGVGVGAAPTPFFPSSPRPSSVPAPPWAAGAAVA